MNKSQQIAVAQERLVSDDVKFGLFLAGAYVVITRVGGLQAAKLGFSIAGLPIFLTDFFLIFAMATVLFARSNSMAIWTTTGGGAGPVGRTVWLILLLAIWYFLSAFTEFGISAVRDLAIYGYSLFFVATYLSVRSRSSATILLQWFTFSGVFAALLLILSVVTGIGTELYGEIFRYIGGGVVVGRGSGDVGAVVAFPLAVLVPYTVLRRERRAFHFLCCGICATALALTTTRSAVFGIGLALLYIFFALRTKGRISLGGLTVTVLVLFLLAPVLPSEIPGIEAIQGLYSSLASGLNFVSDDNVQYRLFRWKIALDVWLANPILGIGFGADILPPWLQEENRMVTFNEGMPHNTFLTILARTGIIGFGFYAFAIAYTVLKSYVFLRKGGGDVYTLASASIIVAMVGFAFFVLFFERPMNGATFWIMLAVATRLSEPDRNRQRDSGMCPESRGLST